MSGKNVARHVLKKNARLRISVIGMGILGLLLPFTTKALPDSWNTEGTHGELHIYGDFVEGTCGLDMASRLQQVDLGTTPTQELRHPGERGYPVTFTLRLRDCMRSGGNKRDLHTGNSSGDPLQPIISVTFQAPADADNPHLVQVHGATGLGLRITDRLQRDIRLGEQAAPQFVSPVRDELVYFVQPERTPAPLTPGRWQASLNFRLNYD